MPTRNSIGSSLVWGEEYGGSEGAMPEPCPRKSSTYGPAAAKTSAVVFISASNQLGAFESGLAAFLVGTIPAVVGGGLMTILIAAGWSRLFPRLAEVDDPLAIRPAEAEAPVAI
jgi:hypothetical protein